MRDIEAQIDNSIDDNGCIKMSCSVPLTNKEVEEFKRVLPQGSSFLSPTIAGNSIHYTFEEQYKSKSEAQRRLGSRLRLFKMFVKARTELTISCNLNLNM